MKQKLILLALVMGLIMVSQDTQSLGMGKIQVRSSLDQPLQASIDLMMSEGEDFSNLTVNIASDADYKRVGLDRTFVPSNIHVSIDEDNPLLVNVTSNGPVSEPIVSLLLDVNWGNGRILREFTILLDPPVYNASQSVVVETAPVAVSDPVAETAVIEEPAPVSEPVVQTRVEAEASQASDPVQETNTQANSDVASAAIGGSDIEVMAGDTLWTLANNNKHSGMSTHQMMMALFNQNQHAFSNNNINQLIKGSRLTIPTHNDTAAISQAEAINMVKDHNNSWAPSSAAVEDYSSFQTTSYDQEPAEQSNESMQYGVELAGGNSDDNTRGEGEEDSQGLSDDAVAEELYNKEAENTELKDRVSELEDIVEQQQAALEVKSNDLATLEDQISNADEMVDSEVTDAVETVTEAVESDDVWGEADMLADGSQAANGEESTEASSDENALDIGEVTLVDADGNESSVDDAVETSESVGATEESTEETTPSFTGTPRPPKPSMVDQVINWVMDNLRWVIIGFIGLLVLIFVPRMLSGRDKDVAEESSFLDDIKARNQDDGDDASDDATTVDTKMNEPLVDDQESESVENMEDDLLADLDKKIDFETEVEEVEDVFEGFDEEVAFESQEEESSTAESSDAVEDESDDGFDLDGFLNDETADEDLVVSDDEAVTKDLTEEAIEASEAAVDEAEEDFDFDLSEFDDLDEQVDKANDDLATEIDETLEEWVEDEEAEAQDSDVDDMDLSIDDDFELDLDDDLDDLEADAEESVQEAEASFDDMLDISEEAEDLTVEAEEVVDDGEIDLGLDLDDMIDEGDVIDTKMDLAKAYLEMGDHDGARNLLKEVAAEGNESQIEEAKKLLDDM